MRRDERLLLAMGQIDEKYIKEAEGKVHTKSIISVAAVLTLIIAIGLYLFIPFAPVTSDLSAYRASSYYPLIEGIEEYRLTFMQPIYKNNFEGIMATIGDMFTMMAPGNIAGGDMNLSPAPGENGTNGNYVESTDNQVDGVIESDLFKMTDKYIFRLGRKNVKVTDSSGRLVNVIRVYSIEKEESTLVSEFEIPTFEGQQYSDDLEMYLSFDCNTITLLEKYRDGNGESKVGVISLDVSDVNNITEKAMVSIDGSLNTSRMVDGRLLLVSEFYFNRKKVDYNDPTTFVPSIDSGDGNVPIEFEDIVFPDQIGNTRYSVVALLDADSLAVLGANALLNFTSDVYVSAENVYITREYVSKAEEENRIIEKNMSDIAVIAYSEAGLDNKGIITVPGYAEDQYSFDELDGYLRVVTTTTESVKHTGGDSFTMMNRVRNVSLYIVDLAMGNISYSLESFAIEGEEATAVRFEGDKVYVCTALKAQFKDPVYFIDLSDYDSITGVDTGIIEGYSEHLIDLGDGFLLGIGKENWLYSKVEIYEQQGDAVVSVAQFMFGGEYSLDYKSYLVNREENIFGFGVDYYYDYENARNHKDCCYVLLQFDGYDLRVLDIVDIENTTSYDNAYLIRAVYIDGYLYITTDYDFVVNRVSK